MANISFFYPQRENGFALGLNAAGGNIGVANVQLLVPIVIALGATGIHLERAGLMWIPLIAIAVIGATLFMDNLATAKSSFVDQVAVAREKHTWVMAILYIGTFGSFVGYSSAFPLLMNTQFKDISTPLFFLGPLVGSLARPFGGKLADRLGGARVTLWNFGAMAVATVGVVVFVSQHNFAAFLACFLVLFVAAGIGNGSTFRMIPAIFRVHNQRDKVGRLAEAGAAPTAEVAAANARRDAAAVIGICAAIGAFGGFIIPLVVSRSVKATGGPATAFALFVVGYAALAGITRWVYRRWGQ
jgi:NNP family nitrate/nitrite transporter-like MFS transporter